MSIFSYNNTLSRDDVMKRLEKEFGDNDSSSSSSDGEATKQAIYNSVKKNPITNGSSKKTNHKRVILEDLAEKIEEEKKTIKKAKTSELQAKKKVEKEISISSGDEDEIDPLAASLRATLGEIMIDEPVVVARVEKGKEKRPRPAARPIPKRRAVVEAAKEEEEDEIISFQLKLENCGSATIPSNMQTIKAKQSSKWGEVARRISAGLSVRGEVSYKLDGIPLLGYQTLAENCVGEGDTIVVVGSSDVFMLEESDEDDDMEETEKVTLKIRDEEKNVMDVPILSSDSMSKIIQAYKKKFPDKSSFKYCLMWDGERLDEDATPKGIEAEDGDIVELVKIK